MTEKKKQPAPDVKPAAKSDKVTAVEKKKQPALDVKSDKIPEEVKPKPTNDWL